MADGGGNSGNFYKAGDYNAICDICGFRYKASRLKRNWKGEMVCEQDFEFRHPQEFVKVRPEKIGVPWARPEGADQFISVCFLWARTAYADVGTADCMIADNAPQTFAAIQQLKFGNPEFSGVPVPYPTIFPQYVCTSVGSLGFSGYGVSGCSLPSNSTGF